MNMMSFTSYSPPQKFHPLSLLAQTTSRKTSGCLRVFDGKTFWSLYLDQGELIYATTSVHLFDRLDRHLRQISRQVPAIVSAVRVQVRLLFENAPESQYQFSSDYHAICWLVDQQYLNLEQANHLIENIAKEVITSFLLLGEGSYEIIEKERFDRWTNLCHFDLRTLVEYCQNNLQRYQVTGKPSSSPAPKPELPQQKQAKLPVSPIQPIKPIQQVSSTNSALTNLPEQASGSQMGSDRQNSTKRKYTIVCIDDSPTVLKTIKAYLDDVSFSVVTISEPLKALMQVMRTQPDIILLDVGMPNLDGYDFCSLLRKNQAFKSTPVIMVTGNTGFIDRARAKLVGASGYLAKPFTQSDLLKIVFKHLD